MKTQKWPKFIQHGATDGVTGSCHRYLANDLLHILISKAWKPVPTVKLTIPLSLTSLVSQL
jgi:hypothetical protein